jgi:hypothetical protein
VRLNFEFTGMAEANIMKGTLMMGEYGLSEWKATRIV